MATEDGPLIQLLRQAGAIILGKTNTSQLLAYSVIQQFGPMARHVSDLTLMMEVLASPRQYDIDSLIPPVPWVVAPHWREDIVLAIMQTLESHFKETADYPSNPPASP